MYLELSFLCLLAILVWKWGKIPSIKKVGQASWLVCKIIWILALVAVWIIPLFDIIGGEDITEPRTKKVYISSEPEKFEPYWTESEYRVVVGHLPYRVVYVNTRRCYLCYSGHDVDVTRCCYWIEHFKIAGIGFACIYIIPFVGIFIGWFFYWLWNIPIIFIGWVKEEWLKIFDE